MPEQEPGIHRPELTEAWSASFLTPLVEEVQRAYGSRVMSPPASTAIAAALAELFSTMTRHPEERGASPNARDGANTGDRTEDAADVEVRTEAGRQLILACLALLEGQARQDDEPSLSPTGSPVAERQMNKLRNHYGNDFDAVFAATQARHSILQNRDTDFASVKQTASGIYVVLQRRMPMFSRQKPR